MADKQSVTDDFMGELMTSDKDVLEGNNPEDLFPITEEVKAEEAKEEEKPLPFYKDPKVQKYIEKQLEKRLKDFKPTAQETFKKEVSESGDDEIVRALTRLVGNDTDEKRSVLDDLKSALDKRDERASQKAYERLQQVQQEESAKEQAEIDQAEEELEEGREEIESHTGVPLTERQWDAYKQFLVRIEPKGGYEEYPDFVETFEVFKNSFKRSNAQAKNLASRGLERSSSAETKETPFLKTEDKQSLWQKIDKIF